MFVGNAPISLVVLVLSMLIVLVVIPVLLVLLVVIPLLFDADAARGIIVGVNMSLVAMDHCGSLSSTAPVCP